MAEENNKRLLRIPKNCLKLVYYQERWYKAFLEGNEWPLLASVFHPPGSDMEVVVRYNPCPVRILDNIS